MRNSTARVDEALLLVALTVELLKGLVWHLAAGGLLLGDAALELLVEALDLVELGGAGILEARLLLANLLELGDELLAALLGGVGLVLVAVRLGQLDLLLDRVLQVVSDGRRGAMCFRRTGL